jgi:YD repeat-containing protein
MPRGGGQTLPVNTTQETPTARHPTTVSPHARSKLRVRLEDIRAHTSQTGSTRGPLRNLRARVWGSRTRAAQRARAAVPCRLRRGQQSTNEAGKVTTYGYDLANRRVSTVDPIGNTTGSILDAAGRQIQQVFADGTSNHFTYDCYRARSLMVMRSRYLIEVGPTKQRAT